MREISKKWPAARLLGPDVSVERALDFIWRTDYALQNPGFCCNDKKFERDLAEWLELPDFVGAWEDRRLLFEKRGQVHLDHLGSHWVASAYIFGPNGPVHPNGEVRLHKNFGKWPNVEEVENELDILVAEFPWLVFDLAIWDSDDGVKAISSGAHPDLAWRLADGKWERLDEPTVESVFQDRTIPMDRPIEQVARDMVTGWRRETTWTIGELKRMWNDRL